MDSVHCCTYRVCSFDIAIQDRLVHVRMCYSIRILAAASIQERRLFRSARPEVRQQFESGD